MNKKILLFTILSTLLFSNGWDVPCLVPSEKVRIPDPNRVKTDFLTKELCTRQSGTYYNCYASSEKLDTYIILDPVSEGSLSCNIKIVTEYFKYVDAACIDTPFPAIDPIYNYSEQWVIGSSVEVGEVNLCNQYNGIIENSTLSCNRYQRCKYIPPSSTDCLQSFQNTPYFSEYTTQGECETSLNTLQYPIIKYDISINNVYEKTCCYADITTTDTNSSSSNSSAGDNSSSSNSNGDTSSTNNSSTGNETSNTSNSNNNNSSSSNENNTSTTNETNTTNTGDISNDSSILAAINNSNSHLSQVNDNLGTVSGRIQVSGDKVYNEVKYQGDRSHEDTNNLITSINSNHDNLMLSVGNIETNLGYMHNQLTTMIDIMRNGSSSGDGTSPGTSSNQGDSNLTVDFDDTGIIQANNNTTKSIENIGKYLGSDSNISDINVTFDEFASLESSTQDALTKMNNAISDMNKSKDELQTMIENEVTDSMSNFENKSKSMLAELLDKIFSNTFNPYQPFIDVGKVPSNFGSLLVPVNIDAINFHKDIYFTKAQLFGDLNDPTISKLYEIIRKLSLFIAVFFGFMYLIRGVANV